MPDRQTQNQICMFYAIDDAISMHHGKLMHTFTRICRFSDIFGNRYRVSIQKVGVGSNLSPTGICEQEKSKNQEREE